jgi:co-chaperonin GroES (HSP10)
MIPTRDNIAVTRIVADKATSSGIILKSSEEPDRAEVIAIGPKVDEVNVGDTVLLNWNKATKVDLNETYVVPITEVVWIY